MSFNNSHMLEMLVKSIRGDMTIMASSDYQEEDSGLSLYINLTKQLEPLKTWEDFTYSCMTKQLHGNTKHTDLWLLTNYYREGLNADLAAEEIGYSKVNETRVVTGLYFRLRRMNITNPFVIIEPIINKGWMDRYVMQYLLLKQQGVHGKFRRFYARFYVLGAFKHFLGNAEKNCPNTGHHRRRVEILATKCSARCTYQSNRKLRRTRHGNTECKKTAEITRGSSYNIYSY